jgi:hypothetical protein
MIKNEGRISRVNLKGSWKGCRTQPVWRELCYNTERASERDLQGLFAVNVEALECVASAKSGSGELQSNIEINAEDWHELETNSKSTLGILFDLYSYIIQILD